MPKLPRSCRKHNTSPCAECYPAETAAFRAAERLELGVPDATRLAADPPGSPPQRGVAGEVAGPPSPTQINLNHAGVENQKTNHTQGSKLAPESIWLPESHHADCPKLRGPDRLCHCGMELERYGGGKLEGINLVREPLPKRMGWTNGVHHDQRSALEKSSVWMCHGCGQQFHSDSKETISHKCDPNARKYGDGRSLGIHARITNATRQSDQYRLTVHRNTEGLYELRETLIDPVTKTIIEENVLAEPDGWDYVYGRMLDEVVERLNP